MTALWLNWASMSAFSKNKTRSNKNVGLFWALWIHLPDCLLTSDSRPPCLGPRHPSPAQDLSVQTVKVALVTIKEKQKGSFPSPQPSSHPPILPPPPLHLVLSTRPSLSYQNLSPLDRTCLWRNTEVQDRWGVLPTNGVLNPRGHWVSLSRPRVLHGYGGR